LLTLIISDVVGDPLDVIASGPTAADPTTYSDALDVLRRYDLMALDPVATQYLKAGAEGKHRETLKTLPSHVINRIIGSNRVALTAARTKAENLGYRVIDLGAFVEGETREVAVAVSGVVRSIRRDGLPVAPPACLLMGGETTVTLGQHSGKGGRNQEFVAAMLAKLGQTEIAGVTILSGGTDGEDGPTDAAGALADAETLSIIEAHSYLLAVALHEHNTYPLFEQVSRSAQNGAIASGLLCTGLTGTNVMDLRVILVR